MFSVKDYDASSLLDGKSAFVWRSGMKHDCTKVMEIERSNGCYKNALGQEFQLEPDLVYGLLKSSDLKGLQVVDYRKLTIVTQKKIGQDTSYIKEKYPLTFQYLQSNKSHFEKRKSAIYKNNPPFFHFWCGRLFVYTLQSGHIRFI